MDCPHFKAKRLRKTRIVDFHRGKLAIRGILLYSHIFKEVGGCLFSGDKFYFERLIAIFRGMYVGVGATKRREGNSLTATIFHFVNSKTLPGSYDLIVVMNRCSAHLIYF